MSIVAFMQTIAQPLGWVLVIGAVVVLLWRVPIWKTTVENRLSNLEKAVDGLTDSVNQVDRKLQELLKRVGEVTDDSAVSTNHANGKSGIHGCGNVDEQFLLQKRPASRSVV